MITEFCNRPSEFAVHKIGDIAQINFYTDISQLPNTENRERWQAQEVRLIVPWRHGLEETVAANLTTWLAMAQEQAGVEPPTTIEDRVGAVENKTATLEETLDVLFGGIV